TTVASADIGDICRSFLNSCCALLRASFESLVRLILFSISASSLVMTEVLLLCPSSLGPRRNRRRLALCCRAPDGKHSTHRFAEGCLAILAGTLRTYRCLGCSRRRLGLTSPMATF